MAFARGRAGEGRVGGRPRPVGGRRESSGSAQRIQRNPSSGLGPWVFQNGWLGARFSHPRPEVLRWLRLVERGSVTRLRVYGRHLCEQRIPSSFPTPHPRIKTGS